MDAAGGSARDHVARLAEKEATLEAQLRRVRQQKDAWRAGQVGEERVAALLSELSAGWRVLHDRRKAARSPANIDHIAIGPTGVHVIDAKNWSGTLHVSERGVLCGRWPRNDETRTVKELAGLIHSELLAAGFSAPVYATIALANDENTAGPIVHDGVAFLPPTALVTGLTGAPETLNAEQVYRIWEFLDDQHPSRVAPLPALLPPTMLPSTKPSRRRTAPSGLRRGSVRRRREPSWMALLQLFGAVVAVLIALGVLESVAKSASHLSPAASLPAASATSAPASATMSTACRLMPAPVAAELLGHPVTTFAASQELCEYRTGTERGPVAIVAYGRALDQRRWSTWVSALYGMPSCGRYTVTPAGDGVGACVDTAKGGVSTLQAWNFDDRVVAAANAGR